MAPVLRDSFALARSSARSLTLADLLALPAVTDLVTAGKALGIGRTTSFELARAGRFPCPIIRVWRNYRVPAAGLLALLGAPASSGWPPQDPASPGHHRDDKTEVSPGTTAHIGPASRGHDANVALVEAAEPDPDRHGLISYAGRPPGGGTIRRHSASPQVIINGRTPRPDTFAA